MKRLVVIGNDIVAIAFTFYILNGVKDSLNTEIMNRLAILQMSNTPESSVTIQTYTMLNNCGNLLLTILFFVMVAIIITISIKKIEKEEEF